MNAYMTCFLLWMLLVVVNHVQALPFPYYNSTEALNYVYYSYSAYCPQNDILQWNCAFCKGDTSGFVATKYFVGSGTDTHGLVGYHPYRKEIVVSFRGTLPTSLQNWITDFEYLQTDGPFHGIQVKVHNGFLRSYEVVSLQVVSEVLNLIEKFPGYDIVLTGHSLGAAVATLLAMDLAYNHQVDWAYVVTFGSPRVGDPAFAAAFNAVYSARSWRVTHEFDIVPHVPLREMFPTEKFHHVGTEVWYYDNGGDVRFGDGSGEDPNESDSNLVDFSLPDHLTYLGIVFIICL